MKQKKSINYFAFILLIIISHIMLVTCGNKEELADVEFEPRWVSDINFRDGFNRIIPHDNRIFETAHFLTFSDSTSDEVKQQFAQMAEESFGELLKLFNISSGKKLGITGQEKKITIFTNRCLNINQASFPNGYILYGLDAPIRERFPDEINARFRYVVKHETMHVLQFLLGNTGEHGKKAPESWFSEGIAEYVSGGASPPIVSIQQLNEWRKPHDHTNPVSIHTWPDFPVPNARVAEYYPMFGLAVRYLLDEKGHAKTFEDVKKMFKHMLRTKDFRKSFKKYMGMSVNEYEENFFNLITDFFNRIESSSQ